MTIPDRHAHPDPADLGPPILPDQAATLRYLDPAAALAFRTPLQEHPPAADAKAAALLTAYGLMLTILARNAEHIVQLLGTALLRWPAGGLLAAWGILSLLSAIMAFRTLAPRFPAAAPSLAFFGDIAALPREEYVRRLEAMSHEEALEQILRYNHNVATICVLKFRVLRKAVRLFKLAFGCWLVLLLLIPLARG